MFPDPTNESSVFKSFLAEFLQPGGKMTNDEGTLEDISYENFKNLYNKWHAILGQTFLGCLESKEYIHTRAGLILLSRVVNVFPTRPVLGEKIMDALAPLKDDTNRQDLRSMALGYSSQLIKARDEGVWEEDLAAAKARREKKEKEAEERKKAAEKQFQEMQKESDAIDRQLGGGGRRDWDDRARSAPRGGGPPGGQMKVRHMLCLYQFHNALPAILLVLQQLATHLYLRFMFLSFISRH